MWYIRLRKLGPGNVRVFYFISEDSVIVVYTRERIPSNHKLYHRPTLSWLVMLTIRYLFSWSIKFSKGRYESASGTLNLYIENSILSASDYTNLHKKSNLTVPI